MDRYLTNLIKGGESQQLDFKYAITDSRKIARTLSAFSNTDGGKLLIGVRDNGSIAGIRSEEEIYMVDTAAQLFCRPEITYSLKQHQAGTKTILEVDVEKGSKRPYQAKDEEGKWRAYFRHHDQNLLANRVMLKVWRKEEQKHGVKVKFSKAENSLLNYLLENKSISLSKFRKMTGISAARSESILANLIVFKIIIMKPSERGFSYELNPDLPAGLSQEP